MGYHDIACIYSSKCLDAPQRLRRELDTVINLQSDLDTIEKPLKDARAALSKFSPSPDTLVALESLERTHERLVAKVETLYSSLNVQKVFPELRGLDLEFVQTLLMAWDLKINI